MIFHYYSHRNGFWAGAALLLVVHIRVAAGFTLRHINFVRIHQIASL